MIRNTPFKLLRKLKRDRLLTFNTKRIDRVDEVQPHHLRKARESRSCTSRSCPQPPAPSRRSPTTGPTCMTHLTTGNDDRARQLGTRRIRRQTRRCVSSARAGDESAESACLRHCHSHALYLERSGRIATLMLEFQMRQAAVISGSVLRRAACFLPQATRLPRLPQTAGTLENAKHHCDRERRATTSRSPKLAQGISIDNRISQDNVEQSPQREHT